MELDGLQPDYQAGKQKKSKPSLWDPLIWVYHTIGGGWVLSWT